MNPLIPIVAIGFGIAYLIKQTTEPPKIGGISKENHFDNDIIRYRVKDNSSNIKRHISRKLNAIIAECDSFKIGKTGRLDRGRTHHDYDNLIWLCESSKPEYIRDLEDHYIGLHANHPKNNNIRRGSAGRMNYDSSKFYLYVITT